MRFILNVAWIALIIIVDFVSGVMSIDLWKVDRKRMTQRRDKQRGRETERLSEVKQNCNQNLQRSFISQYCLIATTKKVCQEMLFQLIFNVPFGHSYNQSFIGK